MARSQIRECYCCSNAGTTVEHIPPRCFFPKAKDSSTRIDLRKQLITVPSCEIHNSSKSKDDEYALYVLTMNLDTNDFGTEHFSKQVIRAIDQRPALINQMLNDAAPVNIKRKDDDEARETLAVAIQTDRFYTFFEQLGHGLFLHHFGKKCYADVSVYPEFLKYPYETHPTVANRALQDLVNTADLLFRNVPYQGANPEIFKYQFANGDARFPHIARLHFYGASRILIFYCPPAA